MSDFTRQQVTDAARGVTVSVVSHGHGDMIRRLVAELQAFPEVRQILVTLNIPELLALPEDQRIRVIENPEPQGFGANHNAAFLLSSSPYFCVLNPDVVFIANPFPTLLSVMGQSGASLAVPRVVNEAGHLEDSLRRFMTPVRLLRRVMKWSSGAYVFDSDDAPFNPEWAAGMFMLFRQEAFRQLRGFDERYFMYCEDADICTRLWIMGGRLVAVPGATVIHPARRASRVNLQHFRWHVASMIRYLTRFSGRLPHVNTGQNPNSNPNSHPNYDCDSDPR